jgi:acetyl esterase
MAEARGIDPELAAAIAGSERADLTGDLAEARRIMGSDGLPITHAETAYGPHVEVTEVVLALPDRSLLLRVYTPRELETPAPALLLLHGGAFVGGDRAAEHARSLSYAAATGCIVVSPEYRLAPENAYPAALEDALSTLEWMGGQAPGIDVDRIGIGGVSAGGAIAAGVALKLRDTGQKMPRVLMLLYPVLDDRLVSSSVTTFTDSPVWDAANTREMWSLYLQGGQADAYAAPARADRLAGLPASYLLVADHDPLRDEALEFARRMVEDGVLVDLKLWSGSYHVFDQLAPEAMLARRALGDQFLFLRRYLARPTRDRTHPA